MKHKNLYPPKQLSNPVADPLLELEQLWSLDEGRSVKMNFKAARVAHTSIRTAQDDNSPHVGCRVHGQ